MQTLHVFGINIMTIELMFEALNAKPRVVGFFGTGTDIDFCLVILFYQEEGCLKEIRLSVEILRSALYLSDECKVSLHVCSVISHG